MHEKKHEMMLDLSLSGGQKSGIFVADQTPTPTRLIEKCDEVGLFEDLRHVNPFEETFRRACEEQKGGQTPTCCSGDPAEAHAAEESLHTPQVFPQLELPNSAEVLFRSSKTFESPPTCGAVTLDEAVVPITEVAADMLNESYKLPTGSTTARQNSGGTTTQAVAACLGYGKIAQKYRTIAEKPTTTMTTTTYMQMPTAAAATIQLIQPQLITLSFPSAEVGTVHKQGEAIPVIGAAIPVQTVKPFILPKLSTPAGNAKQTHAIANSSALNSPPQASPMTYTQPTITHEPSSASLTPTSQLPIKERLKAILSNSSKSRLIEATTINTTATTSKNDVSNVAKTKYSAAAAHHHHHNHKYDGDCVQRKRAAATRYRDKMRHEQKELRRRNVELLAENDKLRARIAHLERQLESGSAGIPSAQIQIPSSTLHLVMNIPQLVVPSIGQPTLQTPITYRVEKK